MNKSSQEYVEQLASQLYYNLKDRYIGLKTFCKRLQAENKNLIWRVQQVEMDNANLREEMKNCRREITLSEKYQELAAERNKWKKLYMNTVKFKK